MEKYTNSTQCTCTESLSAYIDEFQTDNHTDIPKKLNEILQKIESMSLKVDTFTRQLSGCDVFEINEISGKYNESK
jgi:hypothetical protein